MYRTFVNAISNQRTGIPLLRYQLKMLSTDARQQRLRRIVFRSSFGYLKKFGETKMTRKMGQKIMINCEHIAWYVEISVKYLHNILCYLLTDENQSHVPLQIFYIVLVHTAHLYEHRH
jgi:hypothetical protein